MPRNADRGTREILERMPGSAQRPSTSIPKKRRIIRNDGYQNTDVASERPATGSRESVLYISVMPSCIKIWSVVLYS